MKGWTPPPYVKVYESPLGWTLEVFDERLPVDRMLVDRELHTKKPTPEQKRRILQRYTEHHP